MDNYPASELSDRFIGLWRYPLPLLIFALSLTVPDSVIGVPTTPAEADLSIRSGNSTFRNRLRIVTRDQKWVVMKIRLINTGETTDRFQLELLGKAKGFRLRAKHAGVNITAQLKQGGLVTPFVPGEGKLPGRFTIEIKALRRALKQQERASLKILASPVTNLDPSASDSVRTKIKARDSRR